MGMQEKTLIGRGGTESGDGLETVCVLYLF